MSSSYTPKNLADVEDSAPSSSWPSNECLIALATAPDPETEREGFEPSNEVSPVTRFPVAPVQPLRHLSSA